MHAKIIREAQAVYAALSDEEIRQHEPVFIEVDGKTKAVMLSWERYQELVGEAGSAAARAAHALEPLQPEIEAYQRMLPTLLQEHPGKWVAIHRGKVVALSADKSEVTRAVIEKRCQPVYIEKIQKQTRVYDIPHAEQDD